MKKQYQKIGAQIKNLETNKHVLKPTIKVDCFYEKTYLDLINPYSNLIAIGRDAKGKHIYPESVNFEEYLEYNKIDAEICGTLHILIGCFEKKLKNFLMHTYCNKMKCAGDKQVKDYSWIQDYCSGKQVFDLIPIKKEFSGGKICQASSKTQERRKGVLSDLLDTIQPGHSQNTMIVHYLSKHGYVPMFVSIHSLTLGQLITLFGMLPQKDKNVFLCLFNGTTGKTYSDTAVEKFEKDLRRILVMRNIINHYEPIFPLLENTASYTFASLTSLLSKLKDNYLRSCSFPEYKFNATKTHFSGSSYSLDFHMKIEQVINALKI